MTVHTEAAANITVITSEKPLVESAQSDKLHTVNDVLLRRVREAPEVEVLAYPKTSYGKDDYVYYTAKDLDGFADEAARKYVRSALFPQDPSPTEAEVVALLAPSDLNYVVSIFALSRIGFAILFLSTRLSPEAYINLLRKTNCKKLITCSRYQEVVSQVRSRHRITVFNILEQSAYDVPVPSGPRFPSIRYPNASQRVSFIIHSSGSTGLPKPIFQTHQACIANYSSGIPYRAFLTLPLFHNHGISTTFRAIYAGKRIAIYNANLPLSGSTLVKAMEATEPGSLHCVPYALKLLAETPSGIEALRRCKLVLYGGSSCPDDLGDRLVDAGVYLVGHYGATEMGQLMTSFRDPSDKAWNYMRPLASAKPYLRMVPIGEDLFECVVLDGLPSKVLSNSDDPPGSFHTNDTFVLHPTIPDAWKYIGRLDDRVTLVNGEKVLPIHYENQIREHELVQEAVIFGVGKAIPGLIIIPSEKAKDMSRVDIATSLAPTIAIANERTEAFGRITPDMIEILEVGVEYPRTDKGTVIRAAFYKKFASLIDSIYLRFEAPVDAKGDENLRTLDRPQLEEYLLDVFQSRLGFSSLDKSKDFFEAGVDSLQATTARGTIMREIHLGGQTLGQNVVFEYPNVAALAQHLYALRTGEGSKDGRDELQVMAELISKYSDFKLRRPGTILPDQETVILTGATGSLGAHILSQLVQESHVERVYCLVRASSTDEAKARVIASLESKGLPPVPEERVVFLPTDLSLQTLGLEADVLASLRQSLTTVIHSAWAVNFNLGVASFESQHIRGLYNLINVCLDTDTVQPARFFFCSSISAAAGTPLPAVIPEVHIENLSHAQNMGYARSKLVAENIVKTATEKTGMIARVLRLGQIVGDSTHGIWNQTEAIPLMIRSAVTLKALPALEETPSWMPADKMARAVIELSKLNSSSRCQSCGTITRSKTDDSGTVYQVQNRQLFHWTFDLLRALRRAGLEFRIVSQREWVNLLRHSEPDPEKNPTIKLLDFFAEKYDNDGPGRSDLVFETEKTALASEAVDKGYDVIDSGLVEKMVAWMKKQW